MMVNFDKTWITFVFFIYLYFLKTLHRGARNLSYRTNYKVASDLATQGDGTLISYVLCIKGSGFAKWYRELGDIKQISGLNWNIKPKICYLQNLEIHFVLGTNKRKYLGLLILADFRVCVITLPCIYLSDISAFEDMYGLVIAFRRGLWN